jgi:hypothetical protein
VALPDPVKQNDAKPLDSYALYVNVLHIRCVRGDFFPAVFGSRFTAAELALKGGDNGTNAPGGSSVAPMSELTSFALLTIGATIGIGLRFSKTGVGNEMSIWSRERFYL